jgi:alanyl-tRNA synthetase
MALFGEKYGDTVRAIKFGASIELCGGTHVQATGNIGLFKIVHESAVAAGIRRIEAITADTAEQFVTGEMNILHEVKELLKSPNNPLGAIASLKEENAKMQREVEQLRAEKARAMQGDLTASIEEVNGISLLAKRVDLDASSIKNLAFELKNANPDLMLVFASAEGEKVNISVALGDNLVNNRKMNAGAIVKELAAFVKGGGGGQPFFATAGGKDPDGIDAALNKAKEIAQNA